MQDGSPPAARYGSKRSSRREFLPLFTLEARSSHYAFAPHCS